MRRKCEKSRRDAINQWKGGGGPGVQSNAITMSKRTLLAESEKLVIKPGMKLAWDEELNMMVWR